MPKSEYFYNYLIVCFDRLMQSREEYIKTYNHEHLFRFRVEIKKIRACLKCIEHYYGKKEFHNARKQFKKIFSQAGILRELQLYQTWFRKHHLLQLTKIVKLPEEIKERQEDFAGDSDKIISIIKENRKLILRYAAKLSQEEVYRFYIKILKERLELLQEELEEGKWHKTRKQIKQLRYARNWQDEKAKRILSNTQTRFLDQLQHQIGFWHDTEVMKKWLQEKQKESGKEISSFAKKTSLASSKQIANHAFSKAYDFMEVVKKKTRALVKNKSKMSGKILRPLAQRLNRIDL